MLYVSADVAEARGARMRFTQNVRRNDPDGDVSAKAPPKWLAWTRAAASRGVFPRL